MMAKRLNLVPCFPWGSDRAKFINPIIWLLWWLHVGFNRIYNTYCTGSLVQSYIAPRFIKVKKNSWTYSMSRKSCHLLYSTSLLDFLEIFYTYVKRIRQIFKDNSRRWIRSLLELIYEESYSERRELLGILMTLGGGEFWKRP